MAKVSLQLYGKCHKLCNIFRATVIFWIRWSIDGIHNRIEAMGKNRVCRARSNKISSWV